MGPVRGTPPGLPCRLSVTPASSLAKSTLAWKGARWLTASVLPCWRSRHQAGSLNTLSGGNVCCQGSLEAEGGVEEGGRDWRAQRRHRGGWRWRRRRARDTGLPPCSRARRRRRGEPVRPPGSQARWETSTWIWRRRPSIDTCGAGLIVCESLARTSSRLPAVDGEEERRRRAHVGAVGEGAGLGGAADRDRRGDRSRVLERVEGDPEGGGVGERLDPELDQVGGVVGVGRVGRVGVGAVGEREGVVPGARIARVATTRRGRRGRRRGSPGRGTRPGGRRSRRRSGSASRARCRRSRAAAPWPAGGRGCRGRAAGAGPGTASRLRRPRRGPQRDRRQASEHHAGPDPHPEHAPHCIRGGAASWPGLRAATLRPSRAGRLRHTWPDARAAGLPDPARAAPPPRPPPRPPDGARPGALRGPVRAAHPGHALLGDARPDGDHGAARGDLARRRPGRHLDLPARDLRRPDDPDRPGVVGGGAPVRAHRGLRGDEGGDPRRDGRRGDGARTPRT